MVGIGDPYVQFEYILSKIEATLEKAGASMSDVARTPMFVTDISLSGEISRAHNEFFHDVKPAATLVEIKALQSKGTLAEIEADAVLA